MSGIIDKKFIAAAVFLVAAVFCALPSKAAEAPAVPFFPGSVPMDPGGGSVGLTKESAETVRDFYVRYAIEKGFGASMAAVTDRIDGFEALKGYEIAIVLDPSGNEKGPDALITVLSGDEEFFRSESSLGPGMDMMKSAPFPPFSQMLEEAGDTPARDDALRLMAAHGRLRYSFFRNLGEGGRTVSERDGIADLTRSSPEPDRKAAWEKAVSLIEERAFPTMIKIRR